MNTHSSCGLCLFCSCVFLHPLHMVGLGHQRRLCVWDWEPLGSVQSLAAEWVESDSWLRDLFWDSCIFHTGREHPAQAMPWSFILVFSCKIYCLGGFVITSFIACHKDENLFKRCFEVLWKAVNTESGYAETRLMQYDSSYYTKQLKIMLIFSSWLSHCDKK